jgi:hypothetical protein
MPGGNKRQKEKQRAERRKEKEVRRLVRRKEARERPRPVGDEDPDLAGIVPGPQPPLEDVPPEES